MFHRITFRLAITPATPVDFDVWYDPEHRSIRIDSIDEIVMLAAHVDTGIRSVLQVVTLAASASARGDRLDQLADAVSDWPGLVSVRDHTRILLGPGA